MVKRMVCELSLERVEVGVSGANKTGMHMLLASLVWPRAAIAERVAIKKLRMDGDAADLSKAGWTGRILFKEIVQGPFGIEIGLTGPLADPQIERLLSFVGSTLLKLAAAGAGDAASTDLGGGLMKIPFQLLAGKTTQPKPEDAPLIASGRVDLPAAEEWQAGKTVRVEVPLTAPRTIHKTTRQRRHGEVSARRRTLLKAGESNGRAILTARLYE